jgi:isohexenylglutaconyl-CoA hydratase
MAKYPDTKDIALDAAPGWLTIWLDRPDVRNALSQRMADELRAVFEAVRADRTMRGVTIRGRGGTFSSGGDIKGFATALEGGTDAVVAFSRRAGELFHLVNELPQVVLALVEGPALAGGLGLACAADIIVATENAKFALTETQIGIPPAQIAPLVAQRVGLALARRIMLTAARLDATEAKAIGLVDIIVADAPALDLQEAELRKNVLACAPGANATTKEILLATGSLQREELMDFAAQRFAAAMFSDEGREGIAAFLEKRKPRWAG